MLSPLRLLRPTTVAEAASELARRGEAARVYAGGAELILLMRYGLLRPDWLVDIKPLPGLAEIGEDGGVIRVGAAVTHRRLETDPLVRERLPLFAEAESHIGNIRVRHQGTLGGNLCFADPHADPATVLLVHEATVTVAGPAGERRLSLDDFLVGTYEVALEPGEILTQVQVPPLPARLRHVFLRIEHLPRPTANVAVAVQATDGRVTEARFAVGCIGPRAMRLTGLEERVRGLRVEEAQRAIDECGPYLTDLLDPIDDILGSAQYKVYIAKVLLGRGLARAVEGEDGRG